MESSPPVSTVRLKVWNNPLLCACFASSKIQLHPVRVLPEPAFCVEDKEGQADPSPRPRRGAARTPRVENAAGWRARETTRRESPLPTFQSAAPGEAGSPGRGAHVGEESSLVEDLVWP